MPAEPAWGSFSADQVAAPAQGGSLLDRLWDDGVLPQSFAVA